MVLEVEVVDPEVCSVRSHDDLIDVSNINPGKKIFIFRAPFVVHRGGNQFAGKLRVDPKRNPHNYRLVMRVV